MQPLSFLSIVLSSAFSSTAYAAHYGGQEGHPGFGPGKYGGHASCCKYLEHTLGSKVSYPNTTVYEASLDSYWTQIESSLLPTCILSPTATEDVSEAIKLLSKWSHCNFAVRGGGHTPWAGAANIQDGVTIDLSALNDISLSEDRSIAHVGGGARLGQIYRYLDPLNLGVVGGRVSQVGLGGVTIGGGISFFSPRFGFVCDQVESFELVMANGTTEIISASNKPDLYRALKGGSNNFGIVTHFNLRTFKSGDIWGGSMTNGISSLPEQAAAFEKLTGDPNYDPYAALIHNYVWVTDSPEPFIVNQFSYTKVPAKNETPAFFSDFASIPSSDDTTTVQPLASLTDQIAPPTNFTREIFITMSYRNNASFELDFFSLFNKTISPLLTTIPQFSLSFQSLPQIITSKSTNSNVLGFTPEDGDVVNILGGAAWLKPEDDDLVYSTMKSLFDQGQQMAMDRGLNIRALYLNYAAKFQDPIGGYGEDEVEFLRGVSRKYDPEGMFQTQMPGGFKLWTGKGTG